MKVSLLLIVCFSLLTAACKRDDDAGAVVGTGEITSTELREHVRFLASDDLGGRRIGSAGIKTAEIYISEQMSDAGLDPLPGQADFFLDFPLQAHSFDPDATRLAILGENPFKLVLGTDFRPFAFSNTGEFNGDIVFAGYGITAPEYQYDDYGKIDVEGKIVLILRHEPEVGETGDKFLGRRYTKHALFAEKAKNAADHGAIAMILVTDPLFRTTPEDLRLQERFSFPDTELSERERSRIPSLQISQDSAKRLLRLDATSFNDLQRRIDSGELLGAIQMDLPLDTITVAGAVAIRESPRTVEARNVAGYLEGVEDYWLILGAHHDHIGRFEGPGDTIYNGADDNASGTALLLELAEYYGRKEAMPPWNLVFITFSAEEVGLFGSRAFTQSGWLDIDQIAMMMNFDMIGRNPDDPLDIFGDGFVDGSAELVGSVAMSVGLEVELQGQVHEPMSDHHIFYELQIPFLMFHSDLHGDYHQITDHYELLDYDKMEKIGIFTTAFVDRLVSLGEMPIWVGKP